MTNFIIRHFIADYPNTSNVKVREQYGTVSGLVGIVTNLLLVALKLAAGLVFHSIAIVADAVNNLSDSASSIVTLVGFHLAGKPADREHPYGHARIEYISGLMVAFSVLVLGLQLVRSAFGKIISPEKTEFSWLTIAVLITAILIKIWQSLFYRKVGKMIRSTAIAATAADSRNDVFATGAILIGIVITALTGFNLDGYMGLLVAVFILVSGVRLIIETSNPLLGLTPSRELVDEIYGKIMSYKGILGMHDLNVHNYGPGRCFASAHCEVSAAQDIMVSHDIIDNIERDFLVEKGIHMVIHLDPIVTDDKRTNELRDKVMKILGGISPEITMHDFRVVWGTTHSNLIFDVCIPFGFSLKDDELVKKITDEIRGMNHAYYCVITVDHDYIPMQ
ncbi:MAG: cation transporter [Clostridiales bacterium]|jgi:cation diffusion facilitator family transporter|nr:cation transporter [Clostridiales bacterium]